MHCGNILTLFADPSHQQRNQEQMHKLKCCSSRLQMACYYSWHGVLQPHSQTSKSELTYSFFRSFPNTCPSLEVVILDYLPSFSTQSIPTRKFLCDAVLRRHSTCPGAPSALVEAVSSVVVLHVAVGIDVDTIVDLGLITQLGRHSLQAWARSKASSSRSVRPDSTRGKSAHCCASTVAQAKVVGSVVARASQIQLHLLLVHREQARRLHLLLQPPLCL